jgi:hypothetical protein
MIILLKNYYNYKLYLIYFFNLNLQIIFVFMTKAHSFILENLFFLTVDLKNFSLFPILLF